MPHNLLPSDPDTLFDFLIEMRSEFREGVKRIGEALASSVSEEAAQAAMYGLLHTGWLHDPMHNPSNIDHEGWRHFKYRNGGLDELLTDELPGNVYPPGVIFWVESAAYASQGRAPAWQKPLPSRAERQSAIMNLVQYSSEFRRHARALFGNEYDYIWEGVDARAAIDFQDRFVTLEGLRLLSTLPLSSIQSAISSRYIEPDDDGNFPAIAAKNWLLKRRGFCPSRWTQEDDDQDLYRDARDFVSLKVKKLSPRKSVAEPDKDGMIWVPRSSDGEQFMPDKVVRPARGRADTPFSITVGKKGEEKNYSDFYEALQALADMRVARWRRRNSENNWGTVRAHGEWVKVKKADVDQQLAKKAGEVS